MLTRVPGHVWPVDVVPTDGGFLVFVDRGDTGSHVFALDDVGAERAAARLDVGSPLGTNVVVGDGAALCSSPATGASCA